MKNALLTWKLFLFFNIDYLRQQDLRLQGRAPGFREGREQVRDKTGTRQGHDRGFRGLKKFSGGWWW